MKYLFPMIKTISKERELLKKMMKDLITLLKSDSPLQKKTPYLTKERTFAICLFMYCNGDLTEALELSLLQEIGVLEDPVPK